ncbi:MAG: hypothetical protein M8353_01945 [ANME-2 cluster archaeon]|nr:hypothetical protein [ANME-2 cluster archaeon]
MSSEIKNEFLTELKHAGNPLVELGLYNSTRGGIMLHPHRKIRTFPCHKHSSKEILESEEMSIEDVLKELENMIRGQS